MSDVLTVMLWPLLACLLLPGLLVYLGLHIVRRGIIFVDLALAQVATLGTSVAILCDWGSRSWQAFACALAFTSMGALLFAFTRHDARARVPQEALIGIVYVVAAAAGMLLLSRSPEGNEELRRALIGDVLLVNEQQVWRTFLLYTVIAFVHAVFRRQFLAISFFPEQAAKAGLRMRRWDFLFYLLFGLVVTSFVQIGGVLLVFSYLIVPAVCANFVAERLPALLLVGWLTATLGGVAGLWFSMQFDLPTGAAIVCVLGAVLLVFGFFRQVQGNGSVGFGSTGLGGQEEVERSIATR